MRGDDEPQDALFSHLSPEARVPQDHPLRTIRRVVDAILVELSPEFDRLYEVGHGRGGGGRPRLASPGDSGGPSPGRLAIAAEGPGGEREIAVLPGSAGPGAGGRLGVLRVGDALAVGLWGHPMPR